MAAAYAWIRGTKSARLHPTAPALRASATAALLLLVFSFSLRPPEGLPA